MTAHSEHGSLRVANWPKTHGGESLPEATVAELSGRGLFLDTCLRQLHVTDRPEPIASPTAPAAVHIGAPAYRFLLEVITGLRSPVPGETNIAGQFNKACAALRDAAPVPVAGRLMPVMHRIANDGKAIRRDHLNGIGGASYGSLVRRLIAPTRGERILIVGTGDLARSMLPLFRDYSIGLWNRHPIRNGAPHRCFASDTDSAREAAQWAHHVILTTPADTTHDAFWREHLRVASPRTIVHLGHRSGELAAWPATGRVFDLDDVFALRRQQTAYRSLQIERARVACADAAREWAARGRRPSALPSLATA